MKRIVVSGLLLIAAPVGATQACTPQTLGTALTVREVTPIAAVLARPEDYAGRRVRVAGTVTDVCSRMGCWLELEASDGGARLRVKVQDGEIVFPLAARGHEGTAEGEVEVLELERAEYVRQRAHEAEAAGSTFDATSVGDGPFRIVRLRGLGAELCF